MARPPGFSNDPARPSVAAAGAGGHSAPVTAPLSAPLRSPAPRPPRAPRGRRPECQEQADGQRPTLRRCPAARWQRTPRLSLSLRAPRRGHRPCVACHLSAHAETLPGPARRLTMDRRAERCTWRTETAALKRSSMGS